MKFGTDMRGRTSHDALLRVQDAEIRLLDTMQHFVSMRVENDKKYVAGLNKMLHASIKPELLADFKDCCSIFKAWDVILRETESLSKTLRLKAEHLSTTTQETLTQLINEKKVARRKYHEERQRLNAEFSKVQDDVAKNRADYLKCVDKLQVDKARVTDLQARGKSGPKMADAKSKCIQTVVRLHKQHNDYILAIKVAEQHQTMMNETALPAVLDWHQERQEDLVHKTKYLLNDLLTQINPCDEDLQNIGHSMMDAINLVSPGDEYSGSFANIHRSTAVPLTDFFFDEKLLDEYTGSLQPGVLEINQLTLGNLQEKLKSLSEETSELKDKISQVNTEQQKLRVEVNILADQMHSEIDLQFINSFLEKKKLCDSYTKDMLEREGVVLKLDGISVLVEQALPKLGEDGAPPASDVLNIQEMGNSDSLSIHSDAASIATVSSTATNPASNLPSNSSANSIVNSNNNNNSSANTTSSGLKDTNFIKSLSKMNPFKKGKSTSSSSSGHGNPDDDDTFSNISNDDSSFSVDKPTVRKKQSNSYERSEPFLKTSNGSETRTSMMMMLEEGQIMEMDVSDAKERMADEEWFHGVLPREEVQRLLVHDGDFLVRESKNKRTHETQFVLSVYWQGYRHFIIQFSPDRGWHFEGSAYPTIQELVHRQHESRVPVTSKSGAILEKPILREWELLNDDIELVMRIGTGNFGEVFKGHYKKTQEVAVKTCKDTLTEDQKIKFLQEGRILKHFHHPNIVRYIGIAAQKQPVMIVMEFIVNGALLQFLKSHGDTQTAASLLQMCVDAASGMAYLAGRGCIHRDLAARNCLVGENNIVKISDFGMSREEEMYVVSTGMKQIPVKWTAPEALNFGKYTSLCDVWSFGVLMWEVFSRGRSPYSGMTNTKARQWVEQGHRLESSQGTPASVYNLMLKCWEYKDEDRPQFKVIHRSLSDILDKL